MGLPTWSFNGIPDDITRNLRQNGGRPDSIQTFRSLRMATDRYREMYGEN